MYAFRQATAADYDFLFKLHCLAMRAYIEPLWGWHEEWQADYFRQKFDPRARKIIVIDGQDAGVLVVEEKPDELYLGLIELLPDFQGRGIGSSILRRLKREAEDKGLPLGLRVLRTNEPARRLYERLGFQVVEDEGHRFRMTYKPDKL